MKALREDADYEDFIRYSKEDAEEALKIAREFVEKASECVRKISTQI